MVTLNEELAIASAPDAIWPLLRDPAVVAACIPGAELSADSKDDVWRGSIRVKFGPTVAVFRGEATLRFDDEARRVTIDGRGIDSRGASRALANSVVELHGEHTSTMKVAGEFTVTGPLETFVNAGGVHVARALLSEFCSNIAAAVAAPAGTQVAADAPLPSAAREPRTDLEAAAAQRAEVTLPKPKQSSQAASELSASGLLWRALLGWIKSLFGKRKPNS